jgi:hypothetical protein
MHYRISKSLSFVLLITYNFTSLIIRIRNKVTDSSSELCIQSSKDSAAIAAIAAVIGHFAAVYPSRNFVCMWAFGHVITILFSDWLGFTITNPRDSTTWIYFCVRRGGRKIVAEGLETDDRIY